MFTLYQFLWRTKKKKRVFALFYAHLARFSFSFPKKKESLLFIMMMNASSVTQILVSFLSLWKTHAQTKFFFLFFLFTINTSTTLQSCTLSFDSAKVKYKHPLLPILTRLRMRYQKRQTKQERRRKGNEKKKALLIGVCNVKPSKPSFSIHFPPVPSSIQNIS